MEIGESMIQIIGLKEKQFFFICGKKMLNNIIFYFTRLPFIKISFVILSDKKSQTINFKFISIIYLKN